MHCIDEKVRENNLLRKKEKHILKRCPLIGEVRRALGKEQEPESYQMLLEPLDLLKKDSSGPGIAGTH